MNKAQERLRVLSGLESSKTHHSRRVQYSDGLVFLYQPISANAPCGELAVCSQNAEFLAFWDFLNSNLQYLQSLEELSDTDLTRRQEKLTLSLLDEKVRLQGIRAACWEQAKARAGLYATLDGSDSHRRSEPCLIRTERNFIATRIRQPFLLAALLLVVVLHTLSSVSRSESSYILSTLEVVLYGAFAYDASGRGLPQTLTTAQNAFFQELPRDVRTAMSMLDLEPEYTLYACCPKCFTLYSPLPSSTEGRSYPSHCNSRRTPDEDSCGTALLKPSSGVAGRLGKSFVPIKTFAYQSLHSWIGRLFSRPELEDFAENAWKENCSQAVWPDIWHAPAIQHFLGPDNETPFSVQPDGSVHLVFSLFIDWFNPFGNKKAGKSHSVGAIYMACLNLPPNLRYQTENIYLAGIIPGPNEPSLDELNHFVKLLVDDLIDLWFRGIFLSKTATRSTGRLVRAAFIPLVCDLPALRKTGGFAGHSSHHFCSFCRLRRNNINNLDRSRWRRRTWGEHLAAALLWKDAGTRKERENLFNEHGLRWSELLRLPYWDPTRYALVDAMHNLYLGELRHHCMEVWGIDVKGKSGTKKTLPHTPEEQLKNLKKAVAAIEKGSLSALQGLRKGYLVAIAELNSVQPERSYVKREYAHALIRWVSTFSNPTKLTMLTSTCSLLHQNPTSNSLLFSRKMSLISSS